MYNAHSYAYNIEKLFKLPLHEADKIAHNPLEYLKGFLDKYDKSEEKANLIEKFDAQYEKYTGKQLEEWEEADTIQMVKDLREILSA